MGKNAQVRRAERFWFPKSQATGERRRAAAEVKFIEQNVVAYTLPGGVRVARKGEIYTWKSRKLRAGGVA